MCRILLVILLALPLPLFAQEKSDYDLHKHHLAKTTVISGEVSPKCLVTGSDYIEISMTNQGYFTIGTANGKSDEYLDDHCQITYGHPYALTSFPVIAVDGSWYRFCDYFSYEDSLKLHQEASTLMFNGNEQDGLKISFALVAKSQNAAVEFILKITNFDSNSHLVSPGFILDPAFGKRGDGIFYTGSLSCSRDTLLTSDQLSAPLEIWEKNTGAKGIGSEINFMSGDPEKIILANWHNVHDNITSDFEQSMLRELYDLVIKMYWPSLLLAPESSYEIRWEWDLIDPDFSSKVFTRWDLPSYISITNGFMFPTEMMTYLETYNTTNEVLQNLELDLSLPSAVTTLHDSDTLNLQPLTSTFTSIDLNTKLIYEDRIIDISADIVQNEMVLESIRRKLFIPATPISDTGLVVLNDSISLADFPDLHLLFSVENEKTGQRILDLERDNIFLFENETRIHDFGLEKYSGGGSNLADVVFVLDVSGSMGDEKDQVVAYLEEFADSLEMRGFDYQIGLVTFSTDIDNVVDLTKDISHIRQVLNNISLWGGVEDSPLALYTASELSFRAGSRRNIIWITDEAYPEHSYTVEQVVNRMLTMDITVHGVGSLSLQTDWFNPIVIPTGGNFYNITGNFRDILLDVTRMESQDIYLLTYKTDISSGNEILLKLEVHYGGLGVVKTYNISTKAGTQSYYKLICYPNPFNPEINLQIYKPQHLSGEVSVYNVLGQRIQKFQLPPVSTHKIVWNGRNDQGSPVGSGFYIVQLILKDAQGIKYRESTRILHLK